MAIALTVTAAFGRFNPGDQITDQVLIAETLASDQAGNVVQVVVPDAPAKPIPPAPKD
jgi:hypothetical protein